MAILTVAMYLHVEHEDVAAVLVAQLQPRRARARHPLVELQLVVDPREQLAVEGLKRVDGARGAELVLELERALRHAEDEQPAGGGLGLVRPCEGRAHLVRVRVRVRVRARVRARVRVRARARVRVRVLGLAAPLLVEVLASPDALMCGLGIDDDAIEP